MKIEERVRASLRRRAELATPDEDRGWEGIQRRLAPARQPLRQRVAIVVVALSVSVAATGFLVEAFRDDPRNEAGVASEPMPPDVLRIRCSGPNSSVPDPAVAVQADGVHVHLIGGPRPAFLTFASKKHGSYVKRVDGTRGVVLPQPGTWSMVCGREFDRSLAAAGGARVEVVDTEGIWAEGRLACELTDLCAGIGSLALRPGEDPITEIRRAVPGIEPGDVVEPSGYPEAVEVFSHNENRTYRVVRDGRIIGAVVLTEGGGFDVWSARACVGTSLGDALLRNGGHLTSGSATFEQP